MSSGGGGHRVPGVSGLVPAFSASPVLSPAFALCSAFAQIFASSTALLPSSFSSSPAFSAVRFGGRGRVLNASWSLAAASTRALAACVLLRVLLHALGGVSQPGVVIARTASPAVANQSGYRRIGPPRRAVHRPRIAQEQRNPGSARDAKVGRLFLQAKDPSRRWDGALSVRLGAMGPRRTAQRLLPVMTIAGAVILDSGRPAAAGDVTAFVAFPSPTDTWAHGYGASIS